MSREETETSSVVPGPMDPNGPGQLIRANYWHRDHGGSSKTCRTVTEAHAFIRSCQLRNEKR